ncbi:hypothetical protein CR513_10192, partial [Mucuna pruriens]
MAFIYERSIPCGKRKVGLDGITTERNSQRKLKTRVKWFAMNTRSLDTLNQNAQALREIEKESLLQQEKERYHDNMIKTLIYHPQKMKKPTYVSLLIQLLKLKKRFAQQ